MFDIQNISEIENAIDDRSVISGTPEPELAVGSTLGIIANNNNSSYFNNINSLVYILKIIVPKF